MATTPHASIHQKRDTQAYLASLSTAKQTAGAIFKEFGAQIVPVEGDGRLAKFIITTQSPDREADVVITAGIDTSNFEKNGVVPFAHDYKSLPVAKCVSIERHETKLIAVCEFATADMNPVAEQVYRMVKAGFLSAASIGFRPLEWVYNEVRGGVDFTKVELLEFSIVPVPANAEALIAAGIKGDVDLAVIKDWAERALAAIRVQSNGNVKDACPECGGTKFTPETCTAEPSAQVPCEACAGTGEKSATPYRWNRSLSKSFDIGEQAFAARSIEQSLAAKYCGVAIKDLYHRVEPVYSTRMGAFLVSLDVTLEQCHVDDIRNVGSDGLEEPPLYEHIQLNSSKSGEFLVDGLRFVQMHGVKIGIRVEPRWYGLQVTTYTARAHADAARGVLNQTLAYAKTLNFLKGEAFSLSGEFLTRGTEAFGDIFLSEKNQTIGQRLQSLLTEKGAQIENRGVIMLGPPGNGKTLLGRILMNQTPSTFVWCSARDFYYSGGFNGLAEAFEIARESAAGGTPAIIFIEDVDNYLDGHTTDLMKTEMDGISQSRGVVTILTTNYPELLPKALIDRPGRFHDVLRFDLPDAAARVKMLARWLPDLSGDALDATVRSLEGFSGAHVREFARFASIIREQDGVAVETAATTAIEKLQEQRDLITSVQSHGSRYRAMSFVESPKAYEVEPQLAVIAGLGTRKAVIERFLRAVATKSDARESLRADLTSVVYEGDGDALPENRDAVGWKAVERALVRTQRKAEGDLPVEAIADILTDYGFDTESELLRDEPLEDTGEEAAELVRYHTIESLLGTVRTSLDEAVALVAKLIAAEETDPATDVAAEAIETRVERATVEAVMAHLGQAVGTLHSVLYLCGECIDEDGMKAAVTAVSSLLTHASLLANVEKAGARHSMRDQQMLQQLHDLSASLGAACKQATQEAEVPVPAEPTEAAATVEASQDPEQPTKSLDDEIVLILDDEIPTALDDEIVVRFCDEDGAVPTPTTAKDDDEVVVRFTDEPNDEEDRIECDAEMLVGSIREALTAAVAREARAVINSMRGRVD